MKGEAAGLAEDTFTIGPVLSKTCQALGLNQVAVVEHARHKHNMFFTSIHPPRRAVRTIAVDLAELSCTKLSSFLSEYVCQMRNSYVFTTRLSNWAFTPLLTV